MKCSLLPFELGDEDLLCVVGPTASQKTELAIRICEMVGGEIISADSVQVYKHFDLGSGKPTEQERQRAAHHLIDVIDPAESIDAAQYARMADEAIARIRASGRVPIVCGGSFLWVRALVNGLAEAPAASAQVRAQLEQEARELGTAALHERLKQLDPELATRLSPNDFVRIQRGLEVHMITGRPLSQLQREHQSRPPRHRARLVGVRWSPDQLEQRMRIRATRWLEQGWLEEVRKLVEMGYRDSRPMGSIGYRQVLDYAEGRLNEADVLNEVVRATKSFARRQRTWLREAPVTWLTPLSA